ncbi:MAG TPA: hypothetical protein V6D48_21705, partial [Oculatellaceae cyanobacterium]
AQKIFGRGFIGLFPKHRKGWPREGIEEQVRQSMEQHIDPTFRRLLVESEVFFLGGDRKRLF